MEAARPIVSLVATRAAAYEPATAREALRPLPPFPLTSGHFQLHAVQAPCTHAGFLCGHELDFPHSLMQRKISKKKNPPPLDLRLAWLPWRGGTTARWVTVSSLLALHPDC